MPISLSGGVTKGVPLTDAERHAAQHVLAKLGQSGGGLGPHLFGGSATLSSGSSLIAKGTATLGSSTLLSTRGSDTFMGGVRTAPLSQSRVGSDTVLSGSTARLGMHAPEPVRGGHHFVLTSDTINVAGVTAAHLQAGHTGDAQGTHTITLADKTTIKIAGLTAHDISKLHH